MTQTVAQRRVAAWPEPGELATYCDAMRLYRTRRRLIAGMLLALGAAGCASDSDGQPDSAALAAGLVLAVVPDLAGQSSDVVFAAVPDLLVADDGRVIYRQPESYPDSGSLVPDVWVQPITPAGIESVRTAVDEGDAPQNVEELTALVGSELGDPGFYFSDTFRFAAVPIGEFGDPASPANSDTPVAEWPDTASVSLADAAECTRLPELEVGEVLVTAAQDTVFVDDGIVYSVVAAPDWPGAPC